MTKETYERISKPFRSRAGILFLKILNKGITLGIMLAYIGLVIGLAVNLDVKLVKVLSVPFVGLVILWAVRRLINAPRPYEELEIQPLIVRKKRGESFPSRHAFSALVIGIAWGYVVPWTMAIFLPAGVVLAAVRVIGGIHYPKDVIAGGLFGLFAGLVGFFLL